MNRLLIAVLLSLNSGRIALAFDEPTDPIKAKVDKAKADYEAAVTRLNGGLYTAWEKKEAEARKDGKKKIVDQIKAERTDFEEKRRLPKSIPFVDYVDGMEKARESFQAAMQAAVRDYTRAKEDAKAQAVDKELSEFRRNMLRIGSRSAIVETGFYIIVARHSGLGFDVRERRREGAFVQTAGKGGQTNREFRISPTKDGFYRIYARHSDLPLAVLKTDGGGAIIQTLSDASKACLDWEFIAVPDSDGHFNIVSRESGLGIDIRDAAGEGALCQLGGTGGQPNREFRLLRVAGKR